MKYHFTDSKLRGKHFSTKQISASTATQTCLRKMTDRWKINMFLLGKISDCKIQGTSPHAISFWRPWPRHMYIGLSVLLWNSPAFNRSVSNLCTVSYLAIGAILTDFTDTNWPFINLRSIYFIALNYQPFVIDYLLHFASWQNWHRITVNNVSSAKYWEFKFDTFRNITDKPKSRGLSE